MDQDAVVVGVIMMNKNNALCSKEFTRLRNKATDRCRQTRENKESMRESFAFYLKLIYLFSHRAPLSKEVP